MRQNESNKQNRKNKHLSREKRIQIETLHRAGFSNKEIFEVMEGPSYRTIRREIKGWVIHKTGKYQVQERHNADRGQSIYEQSMKVKGRTQSKKPKNKQLVECLHLYIVKRHHSHGVVADMIMKENLEYRVCTKTIYNLIDQGEIPEISNKALLRKSDKKKKHKTLHRQRKRVIDPRRSIKNQPKHIKERREAGHWEIDLILSGRRKGSAALLILVERKTRKLFVVKIKNKNRH